VAGKPIGVLAVTWLTRRVSGSALPGGLVWADLVAAGLLSGVGFTVSLLVAELAFGAGSIAEEHARLAILLASSIAAAGATVLLRVQRRGPAGAAIAEPAGESV
jgi:NhaA family Na+:H+ antiporter